MYRSYIKSIFDVFVAVTCIIITSPVFILIFIITFITSGGKPFFIQKRPGYKTRIIKLLKFRTMNDNKDHLGNLLPPVQRITPLGKFLRKTSLDEIPQLINVLKGDLSIVGPRPLRIEYLPYYSAEQNRRHDVKPGITGWAQVNGRNALTWEKKFEFDIWYVDNISFTLDLKIMIRTMVHVIRQENINLDNDIISEPFKGIKLHE